MFRMVARLRTSLYLQMFFSTQALTSVPGNKPPALGDTPPGRYAGSLFSAASSTQSLQIVLQDVKHLNAVIKQSEQLRNFLKNSSIKRSQQKQFMRNITSDGFNQTTIRFIQTLIDAGRLPELEKTIQIYISYCKILNKEEDIKVISAKVLNEEEKQRVIKSVGKRRPGMKFKMSYEVDPSILGGLQIYAGTEFLDCSLRSRMDRLKLELCKI